MGNILKKIFPVVEENQFLVFAAREIFLWENVKKYFCVVESEIKNKSTRRE